MNDVQSLLLQVISAALFGGKTPNIEAEHIDLFVKESKSQAVFPLFFSVIKSRLQAKLSAGQFETYKGEFFRYAINGTQNFVEHGELHELMTANDVPYVAMKGLASAMYYPEPSLRTMGDVDFLVDKDNLATAGKLLESIGFSIGHGSENESKHIAYKRPPQSVWEMHRSINGVPQNTVGEKIQAELDSTIDTAETVKIDGFTCRVPEKFHHGLIMLLHTASHLTSEGVGLRHLCDWVVFASSLSDEQFCEIFEKKLNEFGLWRFAQVLTLLGIKYLGAPKCQWAIESKNVDEVTLQGLMEDILSGGNFGKKDLNRYREIKYISERGEHTVSSDGIFRQGMRTLNSKVYSDYPFISRHRVFLPVGWIAESGKYAALLISGKRKSANTKQMLKNAAERKRIYSNLKLFEKL